jgi:hypothetical protein
MAFDLVDWSEHSTSISHNRCRSSVSAMRIIAQPPSFAADLR